MKAKRITFYSISKKEDVEQVKRDLDEIAKEAKKHGNVKNGNP